MTTKYRKKPVVVEAMQFTGKVSGAEILEWSDFKIALMAWPKEEGGRELVIEIETLEGKMIAALGDWIIRGTKGEYYPCKPDIFAECYEPLIPDQEAA